VSPPFVYWKRPVADEKLKEEILARLEQPLRSEGAEIASMALSRYKHTTTLRFFVYSSHGTKLDEYARLSRVIGDVIDGTDWFRNGYTLEVSSPGLDRPLTEARDFKYRIGETVRVEFVDSKRRKLTAEIVSASNSEVEFRHEDEVWHVPLAEIARAKIVF